MSPSDPDRILRRALRELGASLRGDETSAAMSCGPFRLVRPLGEGGVAEVFAAARDGETAVRFAVKVVKPGADGREVVARFERERTILLGLDHPGIVRVSEAGVLEDGRPWFAMPLVDGTAVTVAADVARLDLPGRFRLFRRILDAVAAAHAAGVVHRDLKPGNVLAETGPAELAPRVIDFGMARALGATGAGLTPSGPAHRLGTPDYMSPEQWDLGIAACDFRSDVFSLGILLGELMSGTLPRTRAEDRFEPSTARSRARRRQKPGEVLAPSEAFRALAARDPAAAAEVTRCRGMADAESLARALAAEVDPIAAKATASDPSVRFADASEMANAVPTTPSPGRSNAR